MSFTEEGARHGCAFCRGHMIGEVNVGERYVCLEGFAAGQSFVIENIKGFREGDFIAKYDYNNSSMNTNIASAFCDESHFVPQSWQPNLSVDDLHAIELAFMSMIARGSYNNMWCWNVESTLAVASTVWHRRLPINGTDLWEMLSPHLLEHWIKDDFVHHVDFALRTLILTHGRPAIERKRMPAMSQGNYRTKRAKELYWQQFGLP
jgi:hypothetical protein